MHETTLRLSNWRLSTWHSIPRWAKRETQHTPGDEERADTTDRRQTALVENQSCSSINWWCWVPYAWPYGAEPLRRVVIDSLQTLTQPGTFTNLGQTINIAQREREKGRGPVNTICCFFYLIACLFFCLFVFLYLLKYTLIRKWQIKNLIKYNKLNVYQLVHANNKTIYLLTFMPFIFKWRNIISSIKHKYLF